MKEPHEKPTGFDAYAGNYTELIRDPIRERFAASNHFFFERKLQVIRSFYGKLGIDTGKLSWLDVGCGQGHLLRLGRPYFRSAAGCDPSEGMLQSCADLEVRHQPLIDSLPFDDSSFDFISAVCVYHHVPVDAEARLLTAGQARRLLSSGRSKVIETQYFLIFPERIHKYFAFLEDRLSAIPLGGQYSVFAQRCGRLRKSDDTRCV
ncbi:MAG: hypothetical protein DMG12_02180 [Acidobacteria bacterium]|nr:MAG: hypothetical protein DMG12_02180 [Acidobacteriota bacterium]